MICSLDAPDRSPSRSAVLQLDPSNHLGKQTQLQLLLSLDRYRETLLEIIAASENAGDYRIEQCYALYKLGRMEEAQNVLDAVRAEQGDADEGTQRTLDVLDAQIVCLLSPHLSPFHATLSSVPLILRNTVSSNSRMLNCSTRTCSQVPRRCVSVTYRSLTCSLQVSFAGLS